MRFFLQLDLANLPQHAAVVPSHGLLQLFYCSLDNGTCETWAPFSGASHVRIVEAPVAQLTNAIAPDPLPKKVIDRWEQFDDTPHPEEFEGLGLGITYDFAAMTAAIRCENPSLELEGLDIDVAEQISQAATHDKLGGWPFWVQGVEYPQCPICHDAMALLFQLDSEDSVPYMFGDSGCGHITQCRHHPRQLAFGWACC